MYKRHSTKEREQWPEGHRPCAKCGEMLSLDNFYNHPSGLFGKNSKCKKCHYQGTWKGYNDKPLNVLLFEWAKVRAKKKNLEFSITLEDIVIPDECPVFEKPFARNTNMAASIDRLDSTKGYVAGNIAIISLKANKLKNNATWVELMCVADWMVNL